MVVFIALVLLLACEPERDNPLDPNSPFYTGEGVIIGWVKTRIGEPITEMMLVVEPETTSAEFTFSDEKGFYELKIVAGSCKVIASKEGYAQDSCWVNIPVGEADTVNFFLDILPWFVSCKVHTHHEYLHYHVVFEAEVADGDGLLDIDSVFLWVTGLADTFLLKYNAGVFQKSVPADSLSDSSLETLIGKDCIFLVRDKAGQGVQSNPIRVARIIYETPDVVSPANFEEVGQNPELIWHKAGLSYPYTYAIKVTRIQSGMSRIEVWSKEGIQADDTTVTVPLDISPDIYYWAVWVVDEFGNRSRSRELGFVVK